MLVYFVHFRGSSVPVGGELVNYEYANRLARRGHRVSVIHSFPTAEDRETSGFAGIEGKPPPGFWFPIDPLVDFRAMVLATHASLPEAEVLINGAFWAQAPPDKGTDVVFLQGLSVNEGPEQTTLFNLPVGKVATARWIYDLGLSLGISTEELVYAPNAVDHDVFHPTRPIEHRRPRVAMLCNTRLTIKGTSDGIEALVKAKAVRPDLEAVLFGTDERPAEAPAWMEFRRLPSRRALVDDVFGGSAIYLCPSRKDSFHLPAPESMACGCALVSTDLGITEYAEHDVTALISPRRDPASLAASVVRLLGDESLRLRLARAGIARVKKLSWEKSTDVVERFLEFRLSLARGRLGG